MQFINVIAPNNDLLMDKLNVIYFAPKLSPYVMIWLLQTTDNSTYFVQSLGIRGNESRLYLTIHIFNLRTYLCLAINFDYCVNPNVITLLFLRFFISVIFKFKVTDFFLCSQISAPIPIK